MKLLFVSHSLKMGGAERVLVNIVNYMASNGHEIHICLYDADDIFYELQKHIVIYDLRLEKNSNTVFESVANSIKRILKLKNYIQEQKPCAIISFLTHVNVVSIVASKLTQTPIIACEHSNYNLIKSKLHKLARILIYPLADIVTVLTKGDIAHYPYKKNIRVLPNPIEKPEIFSANKEKVVIGVGRLVHEKGFERLIEAFLQARVDGWKLKIIGAGVKKDELVGLIAKHDATSIIELTGARKDVYSFYQASSIFVLSSREEGYPMALCEAMSYGMACIAFDCKSGPSDIITNDYDGILVEADNTEELAKRIKRVMLDEEKRVLLGKNAVKIYDRIGTKNIVSYLESLINETLK